MARVVGVFNVAHSPTCYRPAEEWNAVRASRTLRADVPMDSLEDNRKKKARVEAAFATLRARLAAARPDALVIFGDDQLECFDFANFPAFALYVGDAFEGALASGQRVKVPGHPELGVALLTGLMQRGFDPAFCMEMPKPERGVGHAFFRPAESLTDLTTPLVPVFINCYYAPQPTAVRCYQLGRAVRETLDALGGDLHVAVVGSGGLWHTPRAPDAYLDEAFDREILKAMAAGDARGMARVFDDYKVPPGDRSQDVGTRGRGVTGLPGPGPQGGTRETCTWIAAAAVADGKPATIVDYVPVYASPIGAGFAYWPQV
jgi:aromatic ring-opening dioxygenase catalytic subunit (LigB family)